MLTEGSDDQRRLLLAVALSLALYLGLQMIFRPPSNQGQEKQETTSSTPTETETAPDNSGDVEPTETSEGEQGPKTTDDREEKEISNRQENREDTGQGETRQGDAKQGTQNQTPETTVLENEKLKATFTNQGATLSNLILKDYHRTARKEEKVQLFDDRFRSDRISFSIRRNDPSSDRPMGDQSIWGISRTSERSITYRHRTPEGLVIEKTFSLPEPDSHEISYDVRFSTPNNSVDTGQLRLYSPGGIVLQSKQDQTYHLGLYGYETDGEWTYENDIGPTSFEGNEIEVRDVSGPVWTGLTTKYFASIFIPEENRKDLLGYRFDPLRTEAAGRKDSGSSPSLEQVLYPDKSMIAYFITESLELDAGEEKRFGFKMYNGPKKESILNQYAEYGLPNLINYGIFGFISSFFISILGFLYQYIGNYGLAILFLTLVVKLCLHPITKRAQVSMHKMKDLQPKIEELQEKYEDDRQKLGEEQMKLFKEHGVNPLGGCLPMVCQIPVLIGLYYGIRVSFQVRQKPFILWINDLSQPDHFMEIGMGTVMGLDFQYLNLLIIFMMATWLIQSLTHPSPGGDSQAAMQQKMFKFMPMIFGVICYNFPSGLVLYWMMSTLFSALEQLYIRKIVLPSS